MKIKTKSNATHNSEEEAKFLSEEVEKVIISEETMDGSEPELIYAQAKKSFLKKSTTESA